MVEQSPIDLARGWPSPSLLPASILAEATRRVLSDPSQYTPALLYGPDPGYEPLRQAIAQWLADSPSSDWTKADNICISGGASQNLACILQAFTDPAITRHVYMVAPTYHLACRILEDHGFAGRLRAVPEDHEGVDIAYLEARLADDEQWRVREPTKRPLISQKHYRNIIYCVPTFSNPSGKTMSLLRRQQLIRLARQHDALIIADDVYDLLSWGSVYAPPRIVDIDQTLDGGPASSWGNAVSNSSFSKILGPGVRTGWATGTPLFVQGLSQCGSTISGGAPSQMLAAVIANCLERGTIQEHIQAVLVPTYQRRCQLALQAVQQYLVPQGVTIDTEVHGGYFVYLHLPHSVDATAVVDQAERLGALVEAGEHFAVVSDELKVPCSDGLRICFAWEEDARIIDGIKRLATALRRSTDVDDSSDDQTSFESHSEDSLSGST